MNGLLNIIIPCYYSSEVIADCFHSLKDQTCKDFVVTLVNDCSPNTDCEYEDIVNFFSIFYQIRYLKTSSNTGPGAARQLGLDNNDCDYVMFVDDDDYLLPNAVESYMSYLKLNESYANIHGLNASNNQFTGLTGSIFNAKILKNLDIRFKNLYCEEDSLFMEEFVIKTSRLCNEYKTKCFNIPVYVHISTNKDSLCHTIDEEQAQRNFLAMNIEICKILLAQPDDFFTRDYIQFNLNNVCIYIINFYDNILETQPFYDLLEKYSDIVPKQLDYSNLLNFKIDRKHTVQKYKEDFAYASSCSK